MEYHVSKKGSDNHPGTAEQPFYTISMAAKTAEAGDTVVVHGGVYRECVNPSNSGRNKNSRILYTSAPGERAVIKGSEQITDWKPFDKQVWVSEVPNTLFGELNPYAETIDGDWLLSPLDPPLHTGQVYIDGTALREKGSIPLTAEQELSWHAEVLDDVTVIYANFGDKNPADAFIEINVRRSCFYPVHTGVNYITVRGFEMAHAACPWAPPTADQPGMLGTHWSKGWIIEDNILHDARCSAISVGKEISTGNNYHHRYHRKPGYQTQLETIFAARHVGWSKERVGSHIIRNNEIYDCGQNGIFGNLGGVFSEIYGNHIYNIGNKHEFFGWEIGGIKLHAAIDVQIHHNYIHDCWLGTWLDWQAQGTRVSSNLFRNNERDLFVEVSHGPYLIDNNIFASSANFSNASQGGAFVHNLFCGKFVPHKIGDRSTPYHLPHSTEIMGSAVVYGFDDRFYQNIFAGATDECGTKLYQDCPQSMEEYVERVLADGEGDVEKFIHVKQPAYIDGNCYFNNAAGIENEPDSFYVAGEGNVHVIEEMDGIYLAMTVPQGMLGMNTKIIGTHNLEAPRIAEEQFENPDGTALWLQMDYLGEQRSVSPTPGPIEALQPGEQKILLWKK